METDLLKKMIDHEVQETIEYGQYLENAIAPLLTPVGLKEYHQLKFFNLGYRAAMERFQTFIVNSKSCTHYWEAIQPEIKVEVDPLTYNAAKVRVKCKHCGETNE